LEIAAEAIHGTDGAGERGANATINQSRGMQMEAYCVKCRQKREIKEPKQVILANGQPAIQGVCPVCGTKLTRFIKRA